MTKPSQDPNKQVSLDDLLRLKRHERPDPAFWDTFQAELHEKTLSTLVRRNHGMSGYFAAGWKRMVPFMPVAAAALFVTLLFLGDYHVSPSHEQSGRELAAAPSAAHDLLSLPQADAGENFDTSHSTARFVIGAMSTRDHSVDRGFTEVHASNRISAGLNAHVQFVSGGLAASTLGSPSGASVY